MQDNQNPIQFSTDSNSTWPPAPRYPAFSFAQQAHPFAFLSTLAQYPIGGFLIAVLGMGLSQFWRPTFPISDLFLTAPDVPDRLKQEFLRDILICNLPLCLLDISLACERRVLWAFGLGLVSFAGTFLYLYAQWLR